MISRGKKLYKISQMHEVGYPHGKIKFLFGDTNAIEPTAVFEKTCHFDELVKEIVVQSELHRLYATNWYPISHYSCDEL